MHLKPYQVKRIYINNWSAYYFFKIKFLFQMKSDLIQSSKLKVQKNIEIEQIINFFKWNYSLIILLLILAFVL